MISQPFSVIFVISENDGDLVLGGNAAPAPPG